MIIVMVHVLAAILAAIYNTYSLVARHTIGPYNYVPTWINNGVVAAFMFAVVILTAILIISSFPTNPRILLHLLDTAASLIHWWPSFLNVCIIGSWFQTLVKSRILSVRPSLASTSSLGSWCMHYRCCSFLVCIVRPDVVQYGPAIYMSHDPL